MLRHCSLLFPCRPPPPPYSKPFLSLLYLLLSPESSSSSSFPEGGDEREIEKVQSRAKSDAAGPVPRSEIHEAAVSYSATDQGGGGPAQDPRTNAIPLVFLPLYYWLAERDEGARTVLFVFFSVGTKTHFFPSENKKKQGAAKNEEVRKKNRTKKASRTKSNSAASSGSWRIGPFPEAPTGVLAAAQFVLRRGRDSNSVFARGGRNAFFCFPPSSAPPALPT